MPTWAPPTVTVHEDFSELAAGTALATSTTIPTDTGYAVVGQLSGTSYPAIVRAVTNPLGSDHAAGSSIPATGEAVSGEVFVNFVVASKSLTYPTAVFGAGWTLEAFWAASPLYSGIFSTYTAFLAAVTGAGYTEETYRAQLITTYGLDPITGAGTDTAVAYSTGKITHFTATIGVTSAATSGNNQLLFGASLQFLNSFGTVLYNAGDGYEAPFTYASSDYTWVEAEGTVVGSVITLSVTSGASAVSHDSPLTPPLTSFGIASGATDAPGPLVITDIAATIEWAPVDYPDPMVVAGMAPPAPPAVVDDGVRRVFSRPRY